LGGSGYRGANVTIPHKLAALELADDATPAARAIGAANTLTVEDGRIEADNTDAAGLIDALGEPPAPGAKALVLGAGGAGRAATFALREAGLEVNVWNRTPERAQQLAAEFGVGAAGRPEPADLLVHATSIGLEPALSEPEALAALMLTDVDPPPLVVDLVYGDSEPPVTTWAKRA